MGNNPGPAVGVRLPEPTRNTDTGYDTYLWPRSKTFEKDRLYAYLHLQGWRFDPTTAEWHTPEREVHQARGRLCHDADLSQGGVAWIQPPAPGIDESRDDDSLRILPKPILRLRYQRFVQGWGWTTITKED